MKNNSSQNHFLVRTVSFKEGISHTLHVWYIIPTFGDLHSGKLTYLAGMAGPGLKMAHFLLKNADIPASYVSLPE